MHRSKLSRSLSCLLMLAFPWSMWAADSSGAMLYANGTAWLNGANVPKTSAVFSGDLIQTKADSVASIKANGSNFTVQSDSLVQYQGQSLKLEHGAVTVATSKAVVTEIGDVSVVFDKCDRQRFSHRPVSSHPSLPAGETLVRTG